MQLSLIEKYWTLIWFRDFSFSGCGYEKKKTRCLTNGISVYIHLYDESQGYNSLWSIWHPVASEYTSVALICCEWNTEWSAPFGHRPATCISSLVAQSPSVNLIGWESGLRSVASYQQRSSCRSFLRFNIDGHHRWSLHWRETLHDLTL